MSTKADHKERSTDTTSASKNLVSLKERNNEKQVLEINKQMSEMELSIDKLNKKLNTTNRTIKNEIKSLSSTDTDITKKVSDTYKQLGALEQSYNELGKLSSQVNKDLNKVNTKISKFEKASSKKLEDVITNQSEINNELNFASTELLAKAEKLSKRVETVSRKLNKSIRDNTKSMTDLETKVVSELELISENSKKTESKLKTSIKSTTQKISYQKAQILLMQSVDEALDKRALQLESTTDNLLSETDNLKQATQTLNKLAAKLTDDIQTLQNHTSELAEQNIKQQGMIDTLQEQSSTLSRSLFALADLESRHFKTLGLMGILLVLAIVGVFYYQQYEIQTATSQQANYNVEQGDKINRLSSQITEEQMASQILHSDIKSIQNELTTTKQKLHNVTTAVVNMNDQLQSVDGRLQYLSPLYNFGTDNTIHGSEWLIKLNEKAWSIKIATVQDKQELYEIAQRYSYYFTKDLGYFVKGNQYTLVYGGDFENKEVTAALLRKMPRFMNSNELTAIENSSFLSTIKK